jgi:hypothetical protein
MRWVLSGHGWADCIVADDQAEAEVTASYITVATDELLTAATRVVFGETEARVQFEGNRLPSAGGSNGRGRGLGATAPASRRRPARQGRNRNLVKPANRGHPRPRSDPLFDGVARQYGESGYQDKWESPVSWAVAR